MSSRAQSFVAVWVVMLVAAIGAVFMVTRGDDDVDPVNDVTAADLDDTSTTDPASMSAQASDSGITPSTFTFEGGDSDLDTELDADTSSTSASSAVASTSEPTVTTSTSSTTSEVTTTTEPTTTTSLTTSTTLTTTTEEATTTAPTIEGVHPDIVSVIDVGQGRKPRSGWSDSYSVGDQCYCATTFDHGIGDVMVDTPVGSQSIRQVCEKLGAGPGIAGRPVYNDIQCGNGPANNAGDEDDCPGRVDIGREGCGQIGPRWDLALAYS